ncbi:gliding motility lipoprotein GldH [Hymenobacter sp. H14-R3]|uniref:gliding motility lipoprotein GldH n=1 Tax=Hymenobacter sp. H14-R3 TaxID=3046308 RepID=UPI0024B932CE|nr:gliding motility lipoprotein GldH [Hymenobacter sp. H14-R3]MDJ0366870.1 gliding motility lipoprotein GldH [Hymenobacter sp. H14-R3]
MPDFLAFTRLLARRFWQALLPLAGAASLSACDPNRVYEDNVDLKSPSGDAYVWDVQQRPDFTFAITDTAARYDVYFNVRNASGYGFYNLYLKHTLTGPDGRPAGPALLHQMVLMDPKTGEPRGAGAGDIFDHQFLALPRQHFARAGTYKLTLEQYMRQNQLPGIMAVGVRVARVGGK